MSPGADRLDLSSTEKIPPMMESAANAATLEKEVAWFKAVLADKNIPDDRLPAAGRVALLVSDGPEKWPYAFLQKDSIPEDFSKAMRASSMEAGPDMSISNMVPRPIDLGAISEAAGDTLEQIEKAPIIATALLWALFVAALAGIFYVTR